MCDDKSPFRHRPGLQNIEIEMDDRQAILTVVFSTSTYALLAIESTLQLRNVRMWVHGTQKDGFVLERGNEDQEGGCYHA